MDVTFQGKVEAQGTFSELTQSKLDFTKMLVAADETQQEEEELEISARRDSVVSSGVCITTIIDRSV